MPTSPAKHDAKAKLESWLTQVWYSGQSAGIWTVLLVLLTGLYKLVWLLSGQMRKQQLAKRHTQPPVLVVGNVIAGGAGKTPIVMAVCQALTARGYKVGVISRGYGRAANRAQVVLGLPGTDTSAAELGDEPQWLLQTTQCPAAVSQNRLAAYNALIQACPNLDWVVSDDGLQHTALPRAVEWVVFDGRLAGNGHLLPRGPLREPLNRLERVDAVLASNVDAAQAQQQLKRWLGSTPVLEVTVKPKGLRHVATGTLIGLDKAVQALAGKSMLAFTGLGNPNKFFDMLSHHGLNTLERMPLPDHFDYPRDFCANLTHEALLTTGKDAVKLAPGEKRLWVLEVTVDLPPELIETLENPIGRSTD